MLDCTFEFNESNRIYKPGETVNCKIKVTVKKKFQARFVLWGFYGVAHCKWIECCDLSCCCLPNPYYGDETFITQYHQINRKQSKIFTMWMFK